MLYWYCREKFCFGHSWEWKGYASSAQLHVTWWLWLATKKAFFVGFSLSSSDVVALSSFCWLSKGYNKVMAKMIAWNAHSWYAATRVMTYEHVPFSLEMKTMVVKLKLEKTNVCAISYLGSALALGHCLKCAPYSSHKWFVRIFGS